MEKLRSTRQFTAKLHAGHRISNANASYTNGIAFDPNKIAYFAHVTRIPVKKEFTQQPTAKSRTGRLGLAAIS